MMHRNSAQFQVLPGNKNNYEISFVMMLDPGKYNATEKPVSLYEKQEKSISVAFSGS